MTAARSALVVACCALTACNTGGPSRARADIRNSGGEQIGSAEFAPAGEDVRVTVQVSGLAPGAHGVHVHSVAKCEPPSFESAGAHFNPGGQAHHGLDGGHDGDLPNLHVGPDGTGRLEAVLEGVTLSGRGHHSLFHVHGTSIVIHKNADDLRSGPSGNSGERIACGVIRPAE